MSIKQKALRGIVSLTLCASSMLAQAGERHARFFDASNGNLKVELFEWSGGFNSGTATSTFWNGTYAMKLLQPITVLPAGAGAITTNFSDGTIGWQDIPGSGGLSANGLDAKVDVGAVGANFSTDGSMFELIDGTSNVVGGLLIRAISTDKNTLFTDTIYGAGTESFSLGSEVAFIVPVPEPETYALMLVGLGMIGAFVRRRPIQT